MAKKPPTKKEIIFGLFDQGLTLKDPRVLAVKVKKQTLYTYWWRWKQLHGITGEEGNQGQATATATVSPPNTDKEKVTVAVPVTPPQEPAVEGNQSPPQEPSDLYSETELNAIPAVEANQSPPQEPTVEAAPEGPVEAKPGSTEDTPDDSGNGKGSRAQVESTEGISTEDEHTEREGGKEKKVIVPRHIPTQGLKLNGIEVSVQTLYLYNVAHAQAKQVNPDGDLSIGDFFDHCVEHYYSDRGYRVGLVPGGKDVK